MQTLKAVWDWLNANQGAAQALSSLITMVLTSVLVFMTIIYVRANVRSTAAIESDLRFRTKPLPELTLRSQGTSESDQYCWTVEVRTSNAPMRFRKVWILFDFENGQSYVETLQVDSLFLRLNETFSSTGKFALKSPVKRWHASLEYTDMANLRVYSTFFDPTFSHLSFENEWLASETIWSRIPIPMRPIVFLLAWMRDKRMKRKYPERFPQSPSS